MDSKSHRDQGRGKNPQWLLIFLQSKKNDGREGRGETQINLRARYEIRRQGTKLNITETRKGGKEVSIGINFGEVGEKGVVSRNLQSPAGAPG